MMESYVRNDIHYVFAVELQNKAQHSMRARMLRTDVEKHEVGVLALPDHAPFFGLELKSCLLDVNFFIIQTEGAHLRSSCRMFLSQRVAFPRQWHKNPSKVGMPFETDTKHI